MSSKAAEFVTGFNAGLLTDSRPFTLLFATDKDGVIGDSTGLPWRCKPDLDRFRELTVGNVVVLGAKTYCQLVKSWPAKHVLKARDVVVVYGVNDGEREIERSEGLLQDVAAAAGKVVGSTLRFLPVPRVMLAPHYDNQRLLHKCQDAIADDILESARTNQRVYVAGGAAMIELLFEKCGHADMTLISHTCKINHRVYLGPKAQTLLRSIEKKPHGHFDAVDEEYKTKANFYFVRL